ncbi:unnamed protein product, partial [Gongylonema pulchrum]|uniref:Bestrophin homolog n=1 Tax=Gongylonema pulchrum TaxID=637853 RepID=A0A183ETB0_9BILA
LHNPIFFKSFSVHGLEGGGGWEWEPTGTDLLIKLLLIFWKSENANSNWSNKLKLSISSAPGLCPAGCARLGSLSLISVARFAKRICLKAIKMDFTAALPIFPEWVESAVHVLTNLLINHPRAVVMTGLVICIGHIVFKKIIDPQLYDDELEKHYDSFYWDDPEFCKAYL